MHGYALLITSRIIFLLVSLQKHIAICEDYDDDVSVSWPSIYKINRTSVERQLSFEEDARKGFKGEEEKSLAAIEYLNEDSEELRMEEHKQPFFRVQSDTDESPKLNSMQFRENYVSNTGRFQPQSEKYGKHRHLKTKQKHKTHQSKHRFDNLEAMERKVVEQYQFANSYEQNSQKLPTVPKAKHKKPTIKDMQYNKMTTEIQRDLSRNRGKYLRERNKHYNEFNDAQEKELKYVKERESLTDNDMIEKIISQIGSGHGKRLTTKKKNHQKLLKPDREHVKKVHDHFKNVIDDENEHILEERNFSRPTHKKQSLNHQKVKHVHEKNKHSHKKSEEMTKKGRVEPVRHPDQDDGTVRMTKGYNPFAEEISNEENWSISSKNEKDTGRVQPEQFYSVTEKNSLTESKYRSPFRSDATEGLKDLAPHSISKQLYCIQKELSDYASIEQEVIGRTVEYNDIVLWKIKEKDYDFRTNLNFRASGKNKYADESPEKKIIFIVHGLTVMGWHDLHCLSKVKRFRTLLNYYIENLDLFDIYLMPMANPDGVTKSAFDGWWNKNVSPQNACPGVNVDRNFDVAWNASNVNGMSSCNLNYPGPSPFSEHESQALRDIFHKYGHKIAAYFNVHAGSFDTSVFKGDAVLYPKGYSDQQGDEDKYVDLKAEIDEAMRNTSFQVISVTVDTLYNWYGKINGTSVDYAATVYDIPYSLELVMQLYEDDPEVSCSDEREQVAALKEIWQVVFDVLFDTIHKAVVEPNER